LVRFDNIKRIVKLFQAKSEISKLSEEVKKMEEKLNALKSQGNLVN
jgi:hypothetical protein